MATSTLYAIDVGIRALLYTKFYDILQLENINKGVILYPKEIALREMAEKRGQPEVELVNVWRTRVGPDFSRMITAAARRGIRVAHTDTTKTETTTIKAMPIKLEYDIWFWTHYRDRLNQIAERYIFWQQDDPNLNLTLNDTYPTHYDLHFGEMVDESVVAEKYDKGQIFILRAPLIIDGWVFSSTDVKTIHKIELVLYDKNDLTDGQIAGIVVESDDSDFEEEEERELKLYQEYIYGIVDLDVDASTFSINPGWADNFSVGEKLYVDDSKGNDGIYTIAAVTDGSTYTVIEVEEEIADSTADGTISLRNYI